MKFENPFTKIKNNEKLISIKKEFGHLGWCFLLPALLMLAIYFALGHKPFGDLSVLVLDLNAQYVYFYEALRDFVWGDGSLLYSFERSLGGEFMGIYAYYIASPLSYIVCLFPKKMMLEALLTIICIKLGICGLTFGFYLHKISKEIKPYNIVIFSTLYALSAYSIVYQNNIMWLDALFLLPILAYSIERLVKEGRYKLYVATLAIMMMSHYYIGYMLCWFTAFYFFFAYFKDENRELVNPTGSKTHFIKSIAKIGGSTVLGIGIAAFVIAAAAYSLQFGKSDFTDPSWDIVPRFDLFDLFPKLLPGSYDTVMHEGLPLLYSGVLTLFAVPLFFMAKKISFREKVFYGSLLLLYVFIMVINPTDLIMHGFQEPNCLNYRYSFILIFLMLVMGYKGFCEIEEFSAKHIVGIGGVLMALVLIAQKFEYPNFTLEDNEYFKYGYVFNELPFFQVILFSVVAIFVIGAVVCYFIRNRGSRAASFVMLFAVCIELFINGAVLICSLGCDVGYSTYSSYVDYFADLRPIVETVQDKDKGFFRSEKTTHRCTNDNMALSLKGLSNSTSTLNQSVISLLDYLGFYADAHWTQYIGSTMITDSLFGIKYIFSNKENEFNKESLTQNELMNQYFELVVEDEKYYAYKNPYALSIAFGVDSMIKDLDLPFEYDYTVKDGGYKNPFEIQNILLNTLLGNDEENMIEFYSPITLTKSNITGANSTVGGNMEYSSTAYDEESYVDFNFTVEKDGPLYLFIPSNWERSFTLFVNDEQYVTNTTYSRIITLGERKAGEEMTLSFRLDEEKLYIYKHTDYLYTLNMDAFEAAYKKLAEGNMQIDEKSTDHHIFGSIKTDVDSKSVMTTIPYDEGWKVYIDGERVETYPILGTSLMAFDIADEGEHTVVFLYEPDIYVASIIVSMISTAIFVALIIIDTRKKKKAAATVVVEATETEEKTEGEN